MFSLFFTIFHVFLMYWRANCLLISFFLKGGQFKYSIMTWRYFQFLFVFFKELLKFGFKNISKFKKLFLGQRFLGVINIYINKYLLLTKYILHVHIKLYQFQSYKNHLGNIRTKLSHISLLQYFIINVLLLNIISTVHSKLL